MAENLEREEAEENFKMDKNGSNLLWSNAIYIIFALIFFSMVLFFLRNHYFQASFYENYYSKEISKVINLAKPGDEIFLDVQKATEIAQKQSLGSFSEIFQFDNVNNEICVQLSNDREKCYFYFNDVDVIDAELRRADPINVLAFKVKNKE